MKQYRWYSLLFLTCALMGCAVNLNSNRYILNSMCIKPTHCCSCYTIMVAEPTVQPGYDTDQIIYLECPYELKAFSRNRWVAPPNTMLTSLIAQSLRNTSYFKAVVTAPYAGQTQYRLETRLLKLQQEFFCRPSRVRMTMQALLIDTNCHQAVCERVFEVVVIAPKNNPYGGVVAANSATACILEQITDFVIYSIQSHPSIPPPRRYLDKPDVD